MQSDLTKASPKLVQSEYTEETPSTHTHHGINHIQSSIESLQGSRLDTPQSSGGSEIAVLSADDDILKTIPFASLDKAILTEEYESNTSDRVQKHGAEEKTRANASDKGTGKRLNITHLPTGMSPLLKISELN
jgi:hypothetical protein